MAGVWGTLATGLFALPKAAEALATGKPGLFYGGGIGQLQTQALGLVVVAAFTFTLSFAALKIMDLIWGIRVEPHVESQGLDVHEHGMWGYPEFYIPVPGGYGTESHGHVSVAHSHTPGAPVAASTAPTEASPHPAPSEG
jgi:Amt family ammonium transporter